MWREHGGQEQPSCYFFGRSCRVNNNFVSQRSCLISGAWPAGNMFKAVSAAIDDIGPPRQRLYGMTTNGAPAMTRQLNGMTPEAVESQCIMRNYGPWLLIFSVFGLQLQKTTAHEMKFIHSSCQFVCNKLLSWKEVFTCCPVFISFASNVFTVFTKLQPPLNKLLNHIYRLTCLLPPGQCNSDLCPHSETHKLLTLWRRLPSAQEKGNRLLPCRRFWLEDLWFTRGNILC